uniref:DUF6598 domain-containing protein n=1 Tax=Leersia perrieri TaxID=77586 RepID=A0A0D9WBZ8_9ORYZ
MAADGGGSGSDSDGDWSCLEPFFYDETAARADGERRLERQRQKKLKEAKEKAAWEAYTAAMEEKKVYELYDPYKWNVVYTRFYLCNPAIFDLDEESSIGPMRHTSDVHQPPLLVDDRGGDDRLRMSSPIVSSDVGFPLLVYGTVIARDVVDQKCLFLFHRTRDHCQLITSEEESLVLNGPPRAMEVDESVFFEVHLKVEEEDQDRDLSKGLIEFRSLSMPRRSQDDAAVGSCPLLDTRLSKVQLSYAYIPGAVEAAVDIQGCHYFHGHITACSNSIPDAAIVLYDSSKLLIEANSATSPPASNSTAVVDLAGRVMAVRAADELVLTSFVEYTPRINGSETKQTICGIYNLLIKVSWSLR